MGSGWGFLYFQPTPKGFILQGVYIARNTVKYNIVFYYYYLRQSFDGRFNQVQPVRIFVQSQTQVLSSSNEISQGNRSKLDQFVDQQEEGLQRVEEGVFRLIFCWFKQIKISKFN